MSEENEISIVKGGDAGTLKDKLFSYVKYLPYFVISVFIALLCSFLYLRYATPIYNVAASLLIKEDRNFGGSTEKFSEMMFFQGNKNLSNEIEILRSLALMERVVVSLDLQTSYYAIGNIRTANIYKDSPVKLITREQKNSSYGFQLKITLLGEDQFKVNEDQKVLNFNQFFTTSFGTFKLEKRQSAFRNRPSNEYNIVWSPIRTVASNLAAGLKIRPVNSTADVLSLSMMTNNSILGRDIINRLMIEYNQSTIEDKNLIAQSTYNFIDNRIKLLSSELGDVETNLEGYKKKNQIFNLEGQTALFVDKITELEKSANENEMKLQIARMVKEYVENKNNLYSLVPSSLGIEDPTLLGLVSAFNQLNVERERKIRETGPENYFVKDVEDKIERARTAILENLSNVIDSYEMIRRRLADQRSQVTGEVSRVPQKEKQIRDIARQQGIKENLYLYLLQKREETAITLASTISNSRVVEQARSSSIPVSPNRSNTYIVSLLLGILVPFIIIYIIDILNDKVQGQDDVVKATTIPIVGTVGHSLSKDLLLVTKGSRKVISEQFRIIRTNLQFFLKQSEKPVVLVTSTFSGEGKSFVTTNVGAVMALAGKKTAILEFDIRKPKITSGLDLAKNAGITNYLVGNASLEDIIIPVKDIENLFLIPCGPIPPNPAELLLDKKVDELFGKLRERFDVLIVDSAPVGLVSDAIELGKYSTCTIYIIRQGYTLKKQLKFIEDIYKQRRLPSMSCLINDVRSKFGEYYGSRRYGYGYGEGHGYYEHEEQTTKIKSRFKRIFGRRTSN